MSPFVPLPGSRKPPLPAASAVGPADAGEVVTVTVRLRSAGDPAALAATAYELGAAPLAERRYLTHDELWAAHGARREDVDAVERYARERGVAVVRSSAGERAVVLRGTLGDLLAMFPAEVEQHRYAMGSYRHVVGDVAVPAGLSGIVTGVFGLDTRPRFRTSHRRRARAVGRGDAPPVALDATPKSPGGASPTLVAATSYASRYRFPESAGGVALDGSGQTIAFVELSGGYRPEDLEAYFAALGQPAPNVVSVSVDGAANAPTVAGGFDCEVMLDLEVAAAVVPRATLVVYFSAANGDRGFLDAISAAIHDTVHRPSVLSISWGVPEVMTDAQGMAAYHELFAAAASLGITVCCAAGDHGTADFDASHWDGKIHVDHPASDDLVLACGGTQLDGGVDVVWNDGKPFDMQTKTGGTATGGGISVVYPVPSYQAGLALPRSLASGAAGRGVPDIAMCSVDYLVRVDGWQGGLGGTSAVAPLMGALVARLNQAKGARLGFFNPQLYALAANGVTRDVTSGTNAIVDTVAGYTAGPGWDACSGLGTPDGEAILRLLR